MSRPESIFLRFECMWREKAFHHGNKRLNLLECRVNPFFVSLASGLRCRTASIIHRNEISRTLSDKSQHRWRRILDACFCLGFSLASLCRSSCYHFSLAPNNETKRKAKLICFCFGCLHSLHNEARGRRWTEKNEENCDEILIPNHNAGL